MRNYAISIYITTPLTIVALGAAILLHYCAGGTDADFWCNICIGIFGSGLLTVFISCVGYASERRKTLEGFYFSTIQIIRMLVRYDKAWERDNKISFLIEYSDMDQQVWDAYYGDICFLDDFSKKKIKYVCEKIYAPIVKFNSIVASETPHLRLYQNAIEKDTDDIDAIISKIEAMLLKDDYQIIYVDGGIKRVTPNLANPVYEELNGKYYDLMYRKSQREEA